MDRIHRICKTINVGATLRGRPKIKKE